MRERAMKTYRLCLFSGFCVLINEVAMSFHLNSNQIELCDMYRNTYLLLPAAAAVALADAYVAVVVVAVARSNPLLCTRNIASLNAKNVNNKYTLVSYSHCVLCLSHRIRCC